MAVVWVRLHLHHNLLPYLMPLSRYGRAQTSESEATDEEGGGSCRQSPLGGLSQVRPTDEEEPHEMNQKGGPQLPACAQLWQPSRFGISLIDPSVRYRSSYAMSILCP